VEAAQAVVMLYWAVPNPGPKTSRKVECLVSECSFERHADQLSPTAVGQQPRQIGFE